jgi:HEAT repeat protein
MSRRALSAVWCLAFVVGASASATAAQTDVGALLADVKSPDFDRAYAAAERLGHYPAERARIVPALIDAISTREWNRCGGDMRDAIARSLGELGARESVVSLLEVVTSGKPIEHECVE